MALHTIVVHDPGCVTTLTKGQISKIRVNGTQPTSYLDYNLSLVTWIWMIWSYFTAILPVTFTKNGKMFIPDVSTKKRIHINNPLLLALSMLCK